jgi:hypothetical protein
VDGTAPSPPPARRATGLAPCAARSLRLAACLLGALWALSAARAGAADLTVTATPTGAPIPSGFLGISTQYKALEAYTGSNPDAIDPAFLHLLGAVAPGQAPVLRVGGESADSSWIPVAGQRRPPGVSYTITPDWLKVARATAQGLHGRLILDLNLEAANRAVAAGEARAMVRTIGRRYIGALEIGNEPELYHHFAWFHTANGTPVYGRPASWSPPEFRAEFASFADAMPKVPLAGPVSGLGTWLEQLPAFLHDEPSVGLTTIHAYPLKHCRASHVVTIPEVLSNAASQGFVAEVAPYVRISHAHGTPIRIDELNAISCGGTARVSDSFATALWMLDTLFGLARAGADGINVNSVPGSINAILNPVAAHGHAAIAVQPEWYAMMMFAQAAPPGARILRVTGARDADLRAWATRDSGGTVHVVLINQSGHTPESTTLHVPAVAGPATVESLSAGGLASTGDVSLGGASFGAATSTGELDGEPVRRLITPLAGAYAVGVPAASAELVTFTPPPGVLLISALRAPQLLSSLLGRW